MNASGTIPSSFDEYLRKNSLPVLVDFWAEWCGPCKMMEPVMKQIAQQFSGRLKVIKVNVDKKPEIAAKYHIQGIPTMILFRDSKPVWRKSGAILPNQLAHELELVL